MIISEFLVFSFTNVLGCEDHLNRNTCTDSYVTCQTHTDMNERAWTCSDSYIWRLVDSEYSDLCLRTMMGSQLNVSYFKVEKYYHIFGVLCEE